MENGYLTGEVVEVSCERVGLGFDSDGFFGGVLDSFESSELERATLDSYKGLFFGGDKDGNILIASWAGATCGWINAFGYMYDFPGLNFSDYLSVGNSSSAIVAAGMMAACGLVDMVANKSGRTKVY